tara:strand:+ start:1144 stop:1431 length:288 start_codon:yes stop_codon:yes gene_type:complete
MISLVLIAPLAHANEGPLERIARNVGSTVTMQVLGGARIDNCSSRSVGRVCAKLDRRTVGGDISVGVTGRGKLFGAKTGKRVVLRPVEIPVLKFN